ncbi:hypothetical protein A0H81_01933 [Grifola frondosa]|uniref:Fungal-type protein kinase domain-containing protein n=1 Tax=Grifola frondosa TaxID=5627 RepID=A0A1C7ML42_GRIFR|nr:hypothetical protein A0H81_01933 [Grifola frondosa]
MHIHTPNAHIPTMTSAKTTAFAKIQFLPEERRLGKTNWLEWKKEVYYILINLDLEGHVDGSEPCPAPIVVVTPAQAASGTTSTMPAMSNTVNQAEIDAWKSVDRKIRGYLITNIKNFLSCGIFDEGKTAKEVWDELCAKREKRSAHMAADAERYLEALVCPEGGDVNAHFDELWRRWYILKQSGSVWTEERFVIAICESLPPSYDATVSAISESASTYDPQGAMDAVLRKVTLQRKRAGLGPGDPFGGQDDISDEVPKDGQPHWELQWIWIELKKDGNTDDPWSDDEDSAFEVDAMHKNKIRGQLIVYAEMAMNQQQRTHLYSVLVMHHFARLIRWDHSGAVISEKFDLLEEPETLSMFFWQFAHATDDGQGYDPSAQLLGPRTKFYRLMDEMAEMSLDGPFDYIRELFDKSLADDWPRYNLTVEDEEKETRYYLVGKPLSVAPGLVGRGTRSYVAWDIKEDGAPTGANEQHMNDVVQDEELQPEEQNQDQDEEHDQEHDEDHNEDEDQDEEKRSDKEPNEVQEEEWMPTDDGHPLGILPWRCGYTDHCNTGHLEGHATELVLLQLSQA